MLRGTEVHLAADTCFDFSCDIVTNLIYVSPTQINFLIPESSSSLCPRCTETAYRVVFMRDGQRIDNMGYILGGPDRLYIESLFTAWADSLFVIADYDVVFQVGYECLFSQSSNNPASSGLSWLQGQYRLPLGAITDGVTGQLNSSQCPVYQGRFLTLWMTGLYGETTATNGLVTAETFTPVGFGVAQLGSDIPSTVGMNANGEVVGTFTSPMPLWAGESPQFAGLDQVNVAFPSCTNSPATTEKRYDAFLTYTSVATEAAVRIYLPFVVRPGDPDCKW
jgi:hypothetical protein